MNTPSTPGRLTGQNALVTGANSGIGEGIARELAAQGANVVVNYVVQPDVAQKICDDINAAGGGKATAIQADVSKEDQVQAMFAEAVRQFGTIDIVCSHAGIQRDAKLVDMTLEQWNQVIGVNLTGAFLCAREAAREFTRRGMRDVSKALGKIIFTSSVHQEIPWAGHCNYATTKGGIMQLMESIAHELRAQRFHPSTIIVVEARHVRRIHVPHAQQRTVGAHQRHHDFRARDGIAGDVVGQRVDVGHDLGLPRARGRAAHAAPERDAHARRLALERPDDQPVAIEEIEPAPADFGKRVPGKRGEVGGVGDQVGLAVKQAADLQGQFGVQRRLVGCNDGSGFEHSACTRSREFKLSGACLLRVRSNEMRSIIAR